MKASQRPSRGAAARIAAGDRAMGARIVQSAIGRLPKAEAYARNDSEHIAGAA